ncbi:hypothetical protein B0T17DRAFT_504183 [Bombardia bombarda]|uniref:Uncharacterized protein n=1 Tax=Bombardia bombarda TaxID=252184 RepID=A0AA40CGV3_9PEZI|nr:hypothetical protein B0T17DRAFT_504183 [Bombardia bombarda]
MSKHIQEPIEYNTAKPMEVIENQEARRRKVIERIEKIEYDIGKKLKVSEDDKKELPYLRLDFIIDTLESHKNEAQKEAKTGGSDDRVKGLARAIGLGKNLKDLVMKKPHVDRNKEDERIIEEQKIKLIEVWDYHNPDGENLEVEINLEGLKGL